MKKHNNIAFAWLALAAFMGLTFLSPMATYALEVEVDEEAIEADLPANAPPPPPIDVVEVDDDDVHLDVVVEEGEE